MNIIIFTLHGPNQISTVLSVLSFTPKYSENIFVIAKIYSYVESGSTPPPLRLEYQHIYITKLHSYVEVDGTPLLPVFIIQTRT